MVRAGIATQHQATHNGYADILAGKAQGENEFIRFALAQFTTRHKYLTRVTRNIMKMIASICLAANEKVEEWKGEDGVEKKTKLGNHCEDNVVV